MVSHLGICSFRYDLLWNRKERGSRWEMIVYYYHRFVGVILRRTTYKE